MKEVTSGLAAPSGQSTFEHGRGGVWFQGEIPGLAETYIADLDQGWSRVTGGLQRQFQGSFQRSTDIWTVVYQFLQSGDPATPRSEVRF